MPWMPSHALGDRRSDFVAEIYQRRQALDEVAQIKLARHLLGLGEEWQTEAEAMITQLQETHLRNRTHRHDQFAQALVLD
jgi:hypothetical protein